MLIAITILLVMLNIGIACSILILLAILGKMASITKHS